MLEDGLMRGLCAELTAVWMLEAGSAVSVSRGAREFGAAAGDWAVGLLLGGMPEPAAAVDAIPDAAIYHRSEPTFVRIAFKEDAESGAGSDRGLGGVGRVSSAGKIYG